MCHNGAFAVWFLSFKKGGKIQTGLNCEVDSLSKVRLWLVYSSVSPFCMYYGPVVLVKLEMKIFSKFNEQIKKMWSSFKKASSRTTKDLPATKH